MDSYQRRPTAVPDLAALDPCEALGDPGAFLRRLIPLEGAEVLSPRSLLSIPGTGAASATVAAVPEMAARQAASIVTQAASILDEEMARGVLAARDSAAAGPRNASDAPNVLRQMHELVDNFASLWTRLATQVPGAGTASLATDETDAVAEVRPRASVRAGERATVSMTLRNRESRPVRLVPTATDLLGSRGGRIASGLLECTPAEVSLAPGEERDLTIATTVPRDAAPGCYSGLLVVSGVEYLRALVTIDVV